MTTDRERELKAQLYQLAVLVQGMRTLQKSYFKTRGQLVLQHAKQAERDVDKAVAEVIAEWIHDPLHFD